MRKNNREARNRRGTLGCRLLGRVLASLLTVILAFVAVLGVAGAAWAQPGPAASGDAAAAMDARSGATPVGLDGCPILQQGASGWCVRILQQLLNNHGIKVKVDALFGPLTEQAVGTFQRAHGLTADGIVGPQTAAALQGKTTGPAPANQSTPVTSAAPPALSAPLTPFEICQKVKPGSVSDGHGGCIADGAIPMGKSVLTCLKDAVGADLATQVWTAWKQGGKAAAMKLVAEKGPKNLFGKTLAGGKVFACITLGI